jgi:hypothetical protein
MRDPKDCPGKLSQPVESWCIYCKKSTKLKGDRTRYVDKTPRWTLGDPPKYVEHRPQCLNCPSEGRPGSARFVPVDATIPSVYKARLSTFEKDWGRLQEDIKAEALGVEPKSSKTPRAPAGPRPSRAKAPAKLKSLEANISSKLENSSTAAEEKQNASLSVSDNYLTTGPTHSNVVNGVAPASDYSPTVQRLSANTSHQSSIGVTSNQPLVSTSDLPLPKTKSKIKRQRIA